MPNYRRARVPGGTWFFTVNLLERRQSLLVDQIETLRSAVANVPRSAMPSNHWETVPLIDPIAASS